MSHQLAEQGWVDKITPCPKDCVDWQPRYYDFNVYSRKKITEKLRYMHRNPVKRGLVESPEQWRWSSFRDYYFGENGTVKIGE